MKSFQQYITEVFDKPYKWRGAGKNTPEGGIKDFQKGNFKGSLYFFKTDDKRLVEVYIYEWDIVPPAKYRMIPVSQKQGRVMEMHFAVEKRRLSGKGKEMSADITGGGDAMRIFATVLDVVGAYIKKNKPDIIRVMGTKTKDDEIGSRLELYKKLIKRYASKLGYQYDNKVMTIGDRKTTAGLELAVMKLVRKGF